jgi:hypothetical protein
MKRTIMENTQLVRDVLLEIKRGSVIMDVISSIAKGGGVDFSAPLKVNFAGAAVGG